MIEINPIDTVHNDDVEELLDLVFGPDRKARTAYKVRDGMTPLPALSFAATDQEGYLLGCIQCWPVMLTDDAGKNHPMIMVGPVAVSPDHQDQGIGRALMAGVTGGLGPDETMPLVLIGDAEYYERHFGFNSQYTGGWRLPGPFEQARLLAICPRGDQTPKNGMIGPYKPR